MKTDQLFKDILQAFFADFLALFLPEIADAIDLERIEFLNQEVFTDIPEGLRRIADVVAQVETREGTPELVLIHTEVQAQRQVEFGVRIYTYNALLRLRRGLPVVSIALVLYPDTDGVSIERVTERRFGRDWTLLEYWQIGIRDLEAMDFVQAAPALAAALAALMKPPRNDRVALKAAVLRRLKESEQTLDEARLFLLVNLVETFLTLDDEETEALRAQLRTEGDDAVEAAELTWADKILLRGREEGILEGREEGILEGREEGILEGERRVLLQQLRARFGDVPAHVEERLRQADGEALDRLAERVVLVHSLKEFETYL